MAITYPLTLPTTPAPRSMTWGLHSAVGSLQSPFTYQDQIQEHTGQRWVVDVSMPPMDAATAGPWRAFIAALRGSRGTFLIGDFSRKTPQGTALGTPLVNGASQTGDELITDGWTINQPTALKAGDWISLGSGNATQLYMVESDVSSDGSGNATITIIPDLRSSPANDASITISDCKGFFRLSTNTPTIFSNIGNTDVSQISFSAVEIIS